MQQRTWWHTALVLGAVLTAHLGLIPAAGATPSPIMHGSTAQGGMQAMARMTMPMGATSAAAHLVTMLHRRVVRVSIASFAFSPANLVVSPGTRIIWTNRDGDPHTVDSTRGVWSSEALDTDGQFARVFKTTGTFSYYCSIHPYMHATIIVKK